MMTQNHACQLQFFNGEVSIKSLLSLNCSLYYSYQLKHFDYFNHCLYWQLIYLIMIIYIGVLVNLYVMRKQKWIYSLSGSMQSPQPSTIHCVRFKMVYNQCFHLHFLLRYGVAIPHSLVFLILFSR